MNVTEIFDTAKSVITVKRVFAEPYEKDGLTIITAARVSGGGGGGEGHDSEDGEGEGGGFGMSGRPAGAYVIKDGHVRWEPAIDVNHILDIVGLDGME
ncbi:MAG: spore germination protein GerW family protein [Ornithinimicrobium sp.]